MTIANPAAARKLGIGMVFQHFSLFDALTVAENIGLRLDSPGPLRRVDWKARRAQARELLDRIGAAIDPDAEVTALSMPEQQLVEIAGALAAGAKVVVMDEPTASLDLGYQLEIAALLGALNRERGTTMVLATHDLNLAASLCDTLVLLRGGRLVAHGPDRKSTRLNSSHVKRSRMPSSA